jgi:hypothetical protein
MAKTDTTHANVTRYRQRMRRAGFRLVQLWVPDTRAQGFATECKRQSRLAARKKSLEDDVMHWVEANTDTEGWVS